MDHGEGLSREVKFNNPLNIRVCDHQSLDKIYKRRLNIQAK
jgi:hypothetical protein